MIIVRDMYQLRFGRIDQAVDLFRRLPDVVGAGPQPRQHHALTDVSGPMYTFVSEIVCDGLSEWDQIRTSFYDQPGFAEWFKEFQLIVQTGRQEYYTVEGDHPGWSRPGVILVRESYRAFKWQIRPAVGLLQRYGALLAAFGVGSNPRIVTDLSGEMFRATIEIETDGLSAWEQQRRHLYRQADFQAWFAQLASAVEIGEHDIFRVEVAQKFAR
jgi:hypothetical protein